MTGRGAPQASLRLARGPGAAPLILRLARGPNAPSGETPPHSRTGRPLRLDSASLEGVTLRRARLHLARGLPGPMTPRLLPRPEH
jgi:hypothetical protein